MAWQPQSPDRPPESAHTLAWAALFFSLVACAMAAIALFKNADTGKIGEKLKTNLKLVGEETHKLLSNGKAAGNPGKPSGAKSGDAGSGEERTKGAPTADSIKERFDKLRVMVSEGDEKASSYLDSLKQDLSRLRNSAAEKGSQTLDRTMEKLQEVKGVMKADSAGAAKKLKELSDEAAPKIKAILARDGEKKAEGPAPEKPEK